jgi:hypothetical protein
LGNWDFAGDEAFVFFIAVVIAIIGAWRWYSGIVRRTRLRPVTGIRLSLALAPLVALAMLWFVLTHWADPKYVVGQLDYQLLFASVGVAWLWLTRSLMPWFGINPLDDAVERANPSAAVVTCGAMLGSMLLYCGANVGSGPTIWTTIVPAIAGLLIWLALWMLVELIAHVSDRIAIDRDLASAWRVAGFLIAMGLILGRAAAGDWTSWHETFTTLIQLGWPAILVAIVLVIFEKTLPRASSIATGDVPAVALVVVAIVYVALLGRAEIGVHVITYEQYMQTR